jgi:carboxyl-terminal processing protease
VYAGGGIMPDVFVTLDTSSYQSNVNKLLLNGSFNNFVYNYYLQHEQQVNQFATAADYTKNFSGANEMWDQFVNYAVKDSVNLKMVTVKDKEALQKRLKAYLARFKWRNAGLYQVLNSDDPVILKAMETISK